eukprot:m.460775 g.460775  ORF g.460775 m.460775 type:complete len:182 (-) comp20344_c2_seq6:20-565(-)
MTDVGLERVKAAITHHPNFPIEGVLFHDVFPIFRDPQLLELLVGQLFSHITATNTKVDVVVGLDARGFLIGPQLAARLGASFVPIRKKGKLPGLCVSVESTKEYGKDILEIQRDAIAEGATVVLVDDLMATGGTMAAAVELIKTVGAVPAECVCIVGLPELNGPEKVDAPCFSLIDLPAGC